MRAHLLILFLFQICNLQASRLILDPVLKPLAGFHYLSGLDDEEKIEDVFLRKGSILRVSIQQSSWRHENGKERKVWVAHIVTKEMSGIGGATEHTQFDFVFKSREEALKMVRSLLLSEEQAEQGGADQPATAVESNSKGKEKPKPESKGRSQ